MNGHGGVDKKDAEGKLSLAFRHPFYPYQRDMQLGDASGRDGPESNTFLVMMTGNHPKGASRFSLPLRDNQLLTCRSS